MNYLSFSVGDSGPTWGVAVSGVVYDLGPTGTHLADSLHAAVVDGKFGAVTPQHLEGAPTHAESEVTMLPCLLESQKVICIGVNYRTHQEESGHTGQKAPTIFTRFTDTHMGHEMPAIKPTSTTKFDYEGEMALVIGKEAWRVEKEDAFDYVAGYANYNDFSVRDWQKAASQWIPGKNFPNTGGFGPYLVPADVVGDVNELTLETRVNGEVRQHASVADLYFDIPTLINYVTGFTKLNPGDVIVTGTPGGVGLFWGEDGLLNDGDIVEVEVTKLGILRNQVVDEVNASVGQEVSAVSV